MVLQSTYPTDIRVRKEIEALVDAGHEVTLLCRGVSQLFGEMTVPEREGVHGANVVRINDRNGRRLLRDQLQFNYNFRYPTWERALDDLIADRDIDAVHAHDLPVVRSCCIVGERHDIPVVADLHESYPAAMAQWRSEWGLQEKLLKTTFLKPLRRYRQLERECLPRATRIITVTEEMRNHYTESTSVTSENISVVRNMADRDFFDETQLEAVLDDGKFHVVFVGRFGPHRGLEMAIRGLATIADEYPDVQLVLVGAASNERYGNKLRTLVDNEGVTDNVVFTGWVDMELVPSYMNDADVGIVLHTESEHTSMALPHKLSQYLHMKCPVVVTGRPPLERVVNDHDCGIVVDDTPEAFGSAIARLSEEASLTNRLSANARHAANSTLNWEAEAENLIDLYETL